MVLSWCRTGSQHLLRGSYVPDTVLTHLILTATLWGGYYYHSHFIDEETEAQIYNLTKVTQLASSRAMIGTQGITASLFHVAFLQGP